VTDGVPRPRLLARARGSFAPGSASGELAHRQESVLLAVLAALAVVSVLTQALQLAQAAIEQDPAELFWWGTNAAFLAGIFALARTTRNGHPRRAATILIAILGTFALVVLLADGISNPMWPLVLAMCVVLATLLLGAQAGLVVAGTGGGTALLVALATELAGFEPLVDPTTGQPVMNAAGIVVVLGFLVLACLLYVRDPGTSIDELVTDGAAESPLRPLRTARLSVREVEVVRLVADGLTDKEIGERLFISPRTAGRHVGNAMEKTETPNRTALGVLAVREGLVALQDDLGAPTEAAEHADLQEVPVNG
jgi:DNA-binding CsgD family transcriptional regulator